MTRSFYPVFTDDDSVSLYNNEFKDIYHSRIGGTRESLEKFIIPSEILDYVSKNNEVKILDICSSYFCHLVFLS